MGVWLPILAAAAQSLPEDQQEVVEYWLSIITGVLLFLIVGLIILTVLIRYIAIRSTRPCKWCMEFVSNTATACPRCGKELKAAEGVAAHEPARQSH